MIEEIKLYLFVISVIFILRFVVEFILKLFQDEPIPMNVSKVEEIFIYFTLSYIITFLIL